MTAKQLITLAAACQVCGEEHKPWQRPPDEHGTPWAPSYASKKDGHSYRSTLPLHIVKRLRELEASR